MLHSPLTSHVSHLTAFADAIALAGCARPGAGGAAGPTGGPLVIVATGDADVLVPPSGAVTTNADVAGLVFSRLADLACDLRGRGGQGAPPLFADRYVRRAITVGIDRTTIGRSLFGGEGEVAAGATARAQWI